MLVAGSCHCGQCICNPKDWWVSGEYCECDDRECDKHDDLVCTGEPYTLELNMVVVNTYSCLRDAGLALPPPPLSHIKWTPTVAEDFELDSLILAMQLYCLVIYSISIIMPHILLKTSVK